MGKLIFVLLMVLTQNLMAGVFRCEIFDLATAQILAESTREIQTHNELFPGTIELRHDMMSATIHLLNFPDEPDLFAIEIEAFEVVNHTRGKFTMKSDVFLKNGAQTLARVFNEMTGIGDNTMTSCVWTK